MKKMMALLLAGVLVATTVGCGGPETKAGTTKTGGTGGTAGTPTGGTTKSAAP